MTIGEAIENLRKQLADILKGSILALAMKRGNNKEIQAIQLGIEALEFCQVQRLAMENKWLLPSETVIPESVGILPSDES